MNKLNSASRFYKGLLASAIIVTALTACSSGKWGFPYRAPLQQGNWITAEQVSLLQQGMTVDQVRYALGSPTLVDMFHSNRWEYPYYFKPGYGEPVLRKFTVWFDAQGLLQRWEGDTQPDFQPSDFSTQQRWKPEQTTPTEATDNGMTVTPLE